MGEYRYTLSPTRDDGVRLSDVQMWDESTRPRHPVSRPTRPYTPKEQLAGRRLIVVHDYLRAELTQLRSLVTQVEFGITSLDQARSHIIAMTMREHDWSLDAYCKKYCQLLSRHHEREDEDVFPQLRRFEPGLAPVLDRLEEEHHAIHAVIEQVDRALVLTSSGVGNLRAAVDLLTDTLLSHLSYEERELTDPLARLWKDGIHFTK